MKELKLNKKTTRIISIAAIAVTVFFGCLFAWKVHSVLSVSKSTGNSYIVLTSTGADAFLDNGLYDSGDIISGAVDGRILLNQSQVETNAKLSAWADRALLEINFNEVYDKDQLVLELTAYSENETPIPVEVTCGGSKAVIWAGKEQKKYYIPSVAKADNNRLLMQFDIDENVTSPVVFGDFCLADYGQGVSATLLKAGCYSTTSYEITGIDAEDASNILGKTTDAQVVGEYVYHLHNGELIVLKEDAEVGRLKGLGDTFSFSVSPDQMHMVVSSRECGAYFVDISDPEKPKLMSRYDTLEWCFNGVIAGNYAFLCNRFLGVEIVDLSDYDNPKYAGRMQDTKDSEYRDCCYADGYLYISTTGNKKIDVYDVRDIASVRRVTSLETDGYGMGLAVSNGCLYVAVSKHPLKEPTGAVSAYGCATGSGLDVFDIQDPLRPKLRSRVKVDGRYNSWPGDNWDVDIYGNYAIVSLMSAGTFVYDVSDSSEPVLLKNINAVVGSDSKLFRKLDPEKTVMTYDYMQETHGAVTHSYVYGNAVYCVTADMGIVKSELPAGMPGNLSCAPKAEGNMPGGSVKETSEFGDVNALAKLPDGNLIAACETEGLIVLNADCKEIYRYRPETSAEGSPWAVLGAESVAGDVNRVAGFGSVKDVRVYGDYIYSAEGLAGFAIYRYESAGGTPTLTEVGRLKDKAFNSCISSVTALDDGSLAILQAGGNGGRYLPVDCRDKSNPQLLKNPAKEGVGNSFHRNVSFGQVGEYIAISGNRINWFKWLGAGETNDLPADGSKGKQEDYQILYRKDESGLATGEWNGLASIGDECIVTTAKGYKVYNPETGKVSDEIAVEDGYGSGKCAVYGNYLIITKTREGKVLVLDITDPKNPVTVNKTDTGCVTDIPCIVGNTVYIPCRHDGIMKVSLK